MGKTKMKKINNKKDDFKHKMLKIKPINVSR